MLEVLQSNVRWKLHVKYMCRVHNNMLGVDDPWTLIPHVICDIGNIAVGSIKVVLCRSEFICGFVCKNLGNVDAHKFKIMCIILYANIDTPTTEMFSIMFGDWAIPTPHSLPFGYHLFAYYNMVCMLAIRQHSKWFKHKHTNTHASRCHPIRYIFSINMCLISTWLPYGMRFGIPADTSTAKITHDCTLAEHRLRERGITASQRNDDDDDDTNIANVILSSSGITKYDHTCWFCSNAFGYDVVVTAAHKRRSIPHYNPAFSVC